ncbi:hypothetical protein FRX31_026030 [Thalictrum thalictroides]|uniref:Uncharacterized protein n=1 Tax=Thalictrum thalictroides TaxID=46969 RepID=A0A7J6VJA7_THATH|nr:hypothetical protein FRX31_026030 [Thalictrum thalictroides]
MAATKLAATAVADLIATPILRRKAAPFSAVIPPTSVCTPKRRISITLDTIVEEESMDHLMDHPQTYPTSSSSSCFLEVQKLLSTTYGHDMNTSVLIKGRVL